MSTFDRLVDAGKSFACSLYSRQPGALIPNPASDVLHLVWDNLCDPGDDPTKPPLPPPPSVPFTGGQCVCVLYEVRSFINGNFSSIDALFGPIGGARLRSVETSPGYFIGFFEILCRGTLSTGCVPEPFWFVSRQTPNVPPGSAVFTIEILKRVDNQPDNCGSPPPQYPPAPPPPSGGYTSPPTSITYNDGSDFTAIFNLVPPTGDSPPPPDICLSVIVSGVELKLCFPFGSPPSFGDDGGDIGDILNNIQNDINNLQDDVDNLQDDFDKFTDPPPPESDPDLNETDSPDDEGGEQDDLPGLKWVLVRLTRLPVKSQFGTPSVNFAGWITFKIGGDYTDRVPIAFENGVFQAPAGATGYAITFTNMAKGISRAYTRDITP